MDLLSSSLQPPWGSVNSTPALYYTVFNNIEREASDQATEEEIQRELDEAASLAVSENCQTYNSLQPEIIVTRQEESETIEMQPEKQRVYHYMVEVSTHQMLYQTVEIVSDHPLTDEQIAERTVEEAQKGSWEPGAIDQNIDINDVTER